MKIGGNSRASCFWLVHHCRASNPITDNISLPYNLVKHYVFLILQKEAIKIVVKGLIML
jgi:hypothetical protein